MLIRDGEARTATSTFTRLLSSKSENVVVEVLLYVHRNRRLLRDGSPGRPRRLSHSFWALKTENTLYSAIIVSAIPVTAGTEVPRLAPWAVVFT